MFSGKGTDIARQLQKENFPQDSSDATESNTHTHKNDKKL